jgi:hypothetical protein
VTWNKHWAIVVCGKWVCEKPKTAVHEKIPTASLPRDPARSTVITEVDYSAAPKSRQYCELTRNLMEGKDELVAFLVLLEEQVKQVHLTFDSNEGSFDKQFKDHVTEVFAANGLMPFDFKAYVAWPKVRTQIASLLVGIVDKLDVHPFSEAYKTPQLRAPGKEPWPFFHGEAVECGQHWAIVICSKDE